MHKLNEEAHSNPQQWQRKAKVMANRAGQSDNTEGASGGIAESSVQSSDDKVYGTGWFLCVLPSHHCFFPNSI